MALKIWTSICGPKIGAGMNRPPRVVVDADAIIAQVNPNDAHHQTATKISESLINMNAQVIYPATAIAEANAYMQRVLNSTASAYGTAVVFTNPGVQVAGVNQETIRNAIKYFSPTTSKKNTLFDCIIASVAEEYQADAVFSFDRFYKSKGFVLAGDLTSK